MTVKTWFAQLIRRIRSTRPPAKLRPRPKLRFEPLEDRLAPATFTVLSAADGPGTVFQTGPGTFTSTTLRGAIDVDNENADLAPDVIQFDPSLAGATITLTANDTFYPTDMGPTAFVILQNITILGDPTHGITLDGDGARRIFGVSANGQLTLKNVTLTAGAAVGGGGGGNAWLGGGGGGGAGLGGALYVYKGSAILTNCTLTGNLAQGGAGGYTVSSGAYAGRRRRVGGLPRRPARLRQRPHLGR